MIKGVLYYGVLREHDLVSVRRIMARVSMDSSRHSLVYNHYWHTDWTAMLQICISCFFPFWQGNSIWRRCNVHFGEFFMDYNKRYSSGYLSSLKRGAAMLYNYRHTVWNAM